MKRSLLFMLSGMILMVFTGCATQQVSKCASPGDTPQHHYIAGMEALEQGNIAGAQSQFERSIYCDERFSPAHGGLAIVYAYKSRAQNDSKYRDADRERITNLLIESMKKAEGDEERYIHMISVIRTNTVFNGQGWLENAEGAYRYASILKTDERSLLYYQGRESLQYFMGLSYLEALEFQKAQKMFLEVLAARKDGKWHEKADRAWKKSDRIERAMAGITTGDVGKKIAVRKMITRGELTALLAHELNIEKLFQVKTGETPARRNAPDMIPTDADNSPFKAEIITILKYKLRGLEPKYDAGSNAYLFKPADIVKRGEMAFIVEDILIKVTGNDKLAIAFLGHDKSPFSDIKPTSPFYNAVMNVTSRGIMEGEFSGEFRVDAPIDGASAVLAIRALKQKLNLN